MTRTPFSSSPPASADMNEFMLPAVPDIDGDMNMGTSPLAMDIFNLKGASV